MRVYFGRGQYPSTNNELLGEVKTFKEAMVLANKKIATELAKKTCIHWYSRMNFMYDFWLLDYGSYENFIKFTDLPEDAREQFDKYMEEKENARH